MIEAICDHLEAVTAGKIKRLLINVPPGCMKSLLVSVIWPAWEWGPAGRAALRYLSTSYSGPNVIRDNNKMRRLVESAWYQSLWGDLVKPSRKWGEKKFDNTVTGGRDGRPFKSLTGGRGDRLTVDDPHSTETAESDADRKTAIRIFRESLSDRLNDMQTSAVVVIMQRLHEGDVSGTILELNDMEGVQKFCVLSLPMEFEPERRCVTYLDNGMKFFTDPRKVDGELLFEKRFPQIVVNSLKIVKGPYAWAGQYQQRPAPREGGLFNVNKIEIIDTLPAGHRKTVRAWDFAASKAKQGTDPDWTVGVRLSRDEQGYVYIEDVIRERNTGNEVRKLFIRTAQKDGGNVRIRYPQDPGAAGKSQAEDMSRAVAGYMFKFDVVTGAKDVRATPISNQVEAGNVFMLRAPWNEDFLAELGSFPAAKHDDQVDALADAFNDLAGVVPGEGLIEYYRQEVERMVAQQSGERPAAQRGDLVGIIGPAGVGMVHGRYGDAYKPDLDGVFWVHPDDVNPLLGQQGWARLQEEELV